jgi:hypothetical protein
MKSLWTKITEGHNIGNCKRNFKNSFAVYVTACCQNFVFAKRSYFGNRAQLRHEVRSFAYLLPTPSVKLIKNLKLCGSTFDPS